MSCEEVSRLWDEYQEERNAAKRAETDRLASAHPDEYREFRRVLPAGPVRLRPGRVVVRGVPGRGRPKALPRHRVGRRRKRHGYAPDNLRWVERSARTRKYLTARQVVDEYPLSRSALYRLKDAGRVAVVKVEGGGLRFLRADLDRYVRQHTAPAVEPVVKPARRPVKPARRPSAGQGGMRFLT
ncbi:MAG: helix-turn-helix domain-containing protein [Gemmataceae bacterium]